MNTQIFNNDGAQSGASLPTRNGSLIVSSYHQSELPEWSDEKLQANIKAAEEQVEAGCGDDSIEYESEVFLAGLLQESERRQHSANE